MLGSAPSLTGQDEDNPSDRAGCIVTPGFVFVRGRRFGRLLFSIGIAGLGEKTRNQSLPLRGCHMPMSSCA